MSANKRFRCPHCNCELFVVNSRNRDGLVRLRRYACKSCDHRLSSVEVPVGDIDYRMDGPEPKRSIVEFAIGQMSDSELLAEIARRMSNG